MLEECRRDQPAGILGWARTHGSLARAYNQLGRHEEARAAGLAVLHTLAHDDLDFVGPNLTVRLEYLIAEAGLGRTREAANAL